MLNINLCGIALKNPLVLASGILGNTWSILKRVADEGVGAVTTKSITLEPKKGYSNPVIVVLKYGIINAMGLPNPGINYFIEELKQHINEIKAPIIVSLAGSTVKEFEKLIEKVSEIKISAIELNLSCPHYSGYGIEVLSDRKLVSQIVDAVCSITSTPILVKVSAHHPNILDIVNLVLKHGARGIVAINTMKAMAIDVYAKKPILSNIFGGLSGPAIHPIAVRVVYEIYREHPEVDIVGVGGVESWIDAVEFLLAGARAIGIGTVIASRGFSAIKEIKRGIVQYLRSEGYSSVKEIIGLAHS